ncbi:Arc family DNA-binding protein [Rhizobium sp. GN54]|uniref:Arc family DNA-binding protein n=1 Tax=Rhizobium sp. GN54 TaxID=2898150 RepID=UPI001E35D801|nr:Arc family DNA-binding protein [Rhizobium sp. GN54]MCD2183304.1 Arc family DNA-binding protein [Rhizobium sp. GN54]
MWLSQARHSTRDMIFENCLGMAVKKTKVKDYDQFQLRLPPGMRERIKAKADRAGMSMNEAIVWCLEEYFPAPATLEDRVNALAISVAALKRGNDLEAQMDEIVDLIDKTLREVADGKISTSPDFRHKVNQRVEEWDMDEIEAAQSRPFDDENWGSDYSIDFADPFPDPVPPEKKD